MFTNLTVYIYSGPGTSEKCLKQTSTTFKSLLKDAYSIKHINREEIIEGSWKENSALLVIPGGADIPYTRSLNGIGNHNIRSYVEGGGAFLGICAGGYYAGSFVEFAKHTPLEVEGVRELAFFPNTVRGPILAPYDYQDQSGARAATIIWKDPIKFEKNSSFKTYYNGGGYFVDAETAQQTHVLASYDQDGKFAAIIECQIGSGKVILSGVHFEYDPNLMDSNDIYLQEIIPLLNNENTKRIALVQHLLERLGLKL